MSCVRTEEEVVFSSCSSKSFIFRGDTSIASAVSESVRDFSLVDIVDCRKEDAVFGGKRFLVLVDLSFLAVGEEGHNLSCSPRVPGGTWWLAASHHLGRIIFLTTNFMF